MSAAAFAAVGVGAMLGAWARWGLATWLNPLVPNLPMGTLAANLGGGYLVGLAVALFAEHTALAPEWRLACVTGFLGALTTFSLVPIPLFLLMGEVFFHTGLGGRMFNAIDRLLGRLPGRLSYVTVLGGTAFATLSGSSMGSTALLGSLMVPEMQKRGYKRHMSIGPILGTGGLAIIIPPSALAASCRWSAS